MSKDRHDVLFESMIADADNPRLKTSLERVKEACDFLEQSRAEITPTTVGRYCDSRWSGPKAQSIRNARGTLLRYVETRRGLQSMPATQRRSGDEPLIYDETVKAYVSTLRAERDEAIRTKNRIIAALRKVPGIPIDELIGNGFKAVAPVATPMPVTLPAAAVTALRKLFEVERLARVGLELHRNRMRNTITGDILLDKPDVEALRLLVDDKTEASQAPALTDKSQKALK